MAYLDVHQACNIVLLTPGNEGNPVVLNPLNFAQTVAGQSAVLTGASGNVALQIPAFYYSYSYAGSTHNPAISLSPFPGSLIHPAFLKNGVFTPFRYIGIYEASWYDVSAAAWVDGDGINAAFDPAVDKIGSIVGKKPLTNKTRGNFRTAAARVGSGWSIMDFWLYNAMKLLYYTRYNNFNSQLMLGAGNSQFGAWAFGTCISATGKVLSVTAPGQTTGGGNSGDYCNFMGVENPFGDVFEFIDGWNINSGVNYVCSTPASFADDTATNYTLFGQTNCQTSGFQATLQPNVGMLPATVGATSATKITDYYWYAGGWVAPFVGGIANDGSYDGMLFLLALYGSSSAGDYVGARLCF